MLDLSRDIHSLTDFKTRTPEFIAELKQGNRAALLTVNGRAEVAVMSAATFQRILDALDILDAIRGVQAGLDDVKAGRVRPIEEFLADFRRKHQLPEREG